MIAYFQGQQKINSTNNFAHPTLAHNNLVMAITVASGECTFSKLKLIKISLKSTRTSTHLMQLAMISVKIYLLRFWT
jgi:hypothetical protein